MHVMVNRVHPDTGVAWERWQDRPVIERSLREAEQAMGLRIVPGRLHELEGHEAPDRALLTQGERRAAERSHDPAFPDRVREHLPELRASRSWEELSSRLAEHGLRLEPKGQGLIITDGEHQVKASRIGRDLSLRRLEERFGAPYPHRDQAPEIAREQERLFPGVGVVAAAAREAEYVQALSRASYHAQLDVDRLRATSRQMGDEIKALPSLNKAFDGALKYVYREPEMAREQIRATATALGADRVEAMLRQEPHRFGDLKTVETKRALGLITDSDDTQARLSARGVAAHWHDVAQAEARSAKLVAEYVQGVEQRLTEALTRVYRDPEAARSAFELALGHAGRDEAIRILAGSPDRLGALRAPAIPSEVARVDWGSLADRALEAVDARHVTSTALAQAHAERAIESVDDRRRSLSTALDQAPGKSLLQNTLARALHELEPAGLVQLRRVLTAPQAAIAFNAHKAVRDMVLGRDELER